MPKKGFTLTFVMLTKGVVEEASDPVGGNGKWYSSCNLKSVDADHFSILK